MAGCLLIARTTPTMRFAAALRPISAKSPASTCCILSPAIASCHLYTIAPVRSFHLRGRCFSMTASAQATVGARAAGRMPIAPSPALTEDEELRLGELADEEPGAERFVEYGRGSPLIRGPDNRHGRADLHAARKPAAVLRGNVSPTAAATPVLPSAATAASHYSGSGGRASGSPPPRGAAPAGGAGSGSAALPGSLEFFDDEAPSSSRRDEDEYAAGSAAEEEDEEEDVSEDEDEDVDGNGTDAEPGGAGSESSAPEWKKTSKAKPQRDKGSRGGAGAGDSGDSRPVANGAIRVPQLRVADASVAGTSTNLGVMPTGQALALARQKGVDLVLVNATAVPPVARLIALHKLLAAQKEAEAERRRASKKTQPKEVRLTSRISPHDLDVKGARVVSFLREGRPVRLSVSYTLAAWMQEEPARRKVLAAIARRLAESGAGAIDVGSIRGEGAALHAQANPCAPAKASAELPKVLSKLAAPIGSPAESDERLRNIQATAAAAMAGAASGATMAAVLPPPGVMKAFRTKRAKGLSSSPGEDEDKRDARDGRAAALDVGGAEDERDTGDFGLGDVSAGGFRPKGRSKKAGRR